MKVSAPRGVVSIVDFNSNAHRIYNQWFSLTHKMGMRIDHTNFVRKQTSFLLDRTLSALPPQFEGTPAAASFEGFRKVIACVDKGCGGREVLYPPYKSARPCSADRPPEFEATFDIMTDMYRERNAPNAALTDRTVLLLPDDAVLKEASDGEADDFIATAAELCKANGLPCIIFSGDRDMLQLIDDAAMCCFYDTLQKGFLQEAEASKKMGVAVKDLLSYKVLAGDPSDGVPGCKGFGKARTIALVNKYHTLDRIAKEGPSDSSLSRALRASLQEFVTNGDLELFSKLMALHRREEVEPVVRTFLHLK